MKGWKNELRRAGGFKPMVRVSMTHDHAGMNARAQIRSLCEAQQQIILQPRRGFALIFIWERDDLSSRDVAAQTRTIGLKPPAEKSEVHLRGLLKLQLISTRAGCHHRGTLWVEAGNRAGGGFACSSRGRLIYGNPRRQNSTWIFSLYDLFMRPLLKPIHSPTRPCSA